MQEISRRPQPTAKPRSRRDKNRRTDLLLFLFFLLFPTICLGAVGFMVYSAGLFTFPTNLTATAVAQKNAECQALIEKAMQASGSFCSQVGSNKACYGNNTIDAELKPDTAQRFSERGDIVDVDKVRRISASPLRLDKDEWGIAILKVIANLPRSLPGQTVTMVVFGNTTLDNESGNLESFFFSSELGQIVCEKVPDDGIMINVPNGEGVRFIVNGADLTLTGDATITAEKNGKMEVSLFEGSGRIESDGEEQYFGAGQQVDVQLGGENGTDAVGPPSAPEAISQDQLDTACALTGEFCSQDEIIPVTSEEAQQEIQEELGLTPTPPPTFTRVPTQTTTPTQTPTSTRMYIPTATATATSTVYIYPTWTASKVPTNTPRVNPPNVPTRANTSTRTPTRTPTRTMTRTMTRTPTRTPTGTLTPLASTFTFTPTPTNTDAATATETPTPTPTSTPTPTNTPIGDPVCNGSQIVAGSLTVNGNSLELTLTNNSGMDVAIDAMHIVWNVGTATRILDISLDGNQIGNANDTISPSDYPSPNVFTGPASRRVIENDGTPTETLTVNFQNSPTGGGYSIQLHFDVGCQIQVP
ncbi:MAG: hypothetical protein HY865_15680 [Chloroflexi bacterium]|nr:hypothetical protein [Chloroflexota bacterium]